MGRLLVVFGATGQQGGSLIDHILNDVELSQQYSLRGITRNSSNAKALELIEKGVDVVQADLNNPSSLTAAVNGAYAVFAVTNFWDSQRAEVEVAQGKAVADAALAAGVTLMIWSSLPNVTEMTHGEVTNVHHYDSKAEVERYVRSLSFPISVFYLAGWYMQNVWHQMVPAPQAEPDGTVVFPLAWPPDMQLPWIDITDTGKYLSPALRDPEKYNGRSLTAATAYYSAQDIVDTWTKVVGKSVRLLKEEEISRFITDPIQEMVVRPGLLLTKYRYFGPTGPGDLEWTHAQLQPKDKLTSWEQFLTRHGPWFEDI